ncbi:MAG: hypothetical protein WD049_08570 [Candidatus Paceibacterota bacterium]
MPSTMKVWRVNGKQLHELPASKVDLESQLEDWIEHDLSLIGLDALVIGRQVHTDYGGFIDLLAINEQGQLSVIELKRSKTPREVVTQCLDYGCWIHDRSMESVLAIYENYCGRSLSSEFSKFFNVPLPEEIDPAYQMIIVAETLDDVSERIVRHLSDVHQVNINAVFFNVFDFDGSRLLARSWLTDPEEVQERSSQGRKQKWTGYLFVNTGITDDNYRHWDLNQQYQFISAGGGPRWINAIKKLNPGDKIFAYIKGNGYVGYGIVEEEAVPVGEYAVGGVKILDKLPEDSPWQHAKDPSQDEWLVKVNWMQTVPESQAKWFPGAFANQNVVCKIRDQNTADYLIKEFRVAECTSD